LGARAQGQNQSHRAADDEAGEAEHDRHDCHPGGPERSGWGARKHRHHEGVRNREQDPLNPTQRRQPGIAV
jgi:hypothetical protein